MARTYARELRSGEPVTQIFLVRNKQVRTSRNGNLYLELELGDRSGSIESRMWDVDRELAESFEGDDFVHVTGTVETYRNQLQLKVDALHFCDEDSVDLSEFLPTTDKDIKELLAEIRRVVDAIKEPHLHRLLLDFFEDKTFRTRFCRAPAAVRYHHAFLGGLLEHTVGVVQLAEDVLRRHPEINGDLLLAGAILHDIGKIDEMSCTRSFQYTDQGELIGHVVLGAMIVQEKAAAIDDFPRHTIDLLTHIILSHHGEYEWGSPKLPMSVEAVALHHLDNIDAKLNAFRQIIDNDQDPLSSWTEWSRMFERRLYKGPRDDSGE